LDYGIRLVGATTRNAETHNGEVSTLIFSAENIEEYTLRIPQVKIIFSFQKKIQWQAKRPAIEILLVILFESPTIF